MQCMMRTSKLEHLRNKFIVFEGWEETGKTSVARALNAELYKLGIDCVLTLQPGGDWGPLAPFFRSLCKDKRNNIGDYANLFAFLLDRAECVDKIIRPSLVAGKTVICDRHTYSTVAYQLFGKQLFQDISKQVGKEHATALLEWFKHPYPDVNPDYVFYFSDRVGNRKNSEHDLFDNEKSEFEKRVKFAYNQMLETEVNWIAVNAGNLADETLENLIETIRL